MTRILHILFIILITASAYGQYVHPNQPGRKGGDTGVGIGNQVVTSTYLGTTGNAAAQGVLMSVNKDGTNKSSFHDFDGFPTDGSYPFYTTPFQASDGILYGTSYLGGSDNLGAIYKYDFINSCKESLIYSNKIGSGSNGNFANINELSDGRIYYPATYGGALGQGAIFSMNKDGSNVLLVHQFSASATVPHTPNAILLSNLDGVWPQFDGIWPYGFVVEGPDGKIYGTCFAGGGHNRGVVYRMDKNGSNYEIINSMGAYGTYKNGLNQNINSFGIYNSWGNVAIDQLGKVYVTGYYGGENNFGGVARMDANGDNYQILLSGSAGNGTYPYRGALIIDDKIYGTFRTNGGGTAIGLVYRMNLDGTGFTKIKTFNSPYTDGSDPWSGLVYDGSFLYGTTLTNGGLNSVGTIFKIRPDGTGFQKIHSFTNIASSGCGSKPGLFTYYPSAERVTFANVRASCSMTCIENPICNAGTISPTLISTTRTNACPISTANLSTLVSSSCVSGTVLKWYRSSSPAHILEVSDPTAVGAGIYFPSCYDSVNDCWGPTPSTGVTVSIYNCAGGGTNISTNCTGSMAFIHADETGSGNIRVWLSKGNGTFESSNYINTGISLSRYGSGTGVFGRDGLSSSNWYDIDKDGDIDLIHVTENNSNSIYVYLNNGNNTFNTIPILTTGMQSDGGSMEIFAGQTASEQGWFKDTNGDGIFDYIFSGNNNRITVWFGNLNGTFSVNRSQQTTLTGTSINNTSGISSSEYFMAEDVTGDGIADIIGTYDESGSARITVWRGLGNGTFTAAPFYTRLLEDTGTSNSAGLADNEYSQFVDINGDGFLDYVHAENYDSTPDIWVWVNDGTGRYTSAPIRTAIPNLAVNLPAGGLSAFANYTTGAQSFFADVNNDGRTDFVNTNDDIGSNSGFSVYLNLGNSIFSTTPIRTLIPNDFRTGSDNSTETAYLGCGFISTLLNPNPVVKGAGVIDCSRIQIFPIPEKGISSQLNMKITVNVTTIGSFAFTVNGSGLSIANSTQSFVATNLGIQDFFIPLNYDGSDLGSFNFSFGDNGCSVDLTNPTGKKQVISNIWTLDCVPTVGPNFN